MKFLLNLPYRSDLLTAQLKPSLRSCGTKAAPQSTSSERPSVSTGLKGHLVNFLFLHMRPFNARILKDLARLS